MIQFFAKSANYEILMGQIEYAVLANEQGVASCVVLCLGGACAVGSLALPMPHVNWQLAVYGICISLFVLLIEYPRGKRSTGRTVKRTGQYPLSQMVSMFGVVGRSYFIRFLLYFLCGIPCLFNLGTLLGGLCLLITSCIYLRAAVAGEKWTPCEREVHRDKSYTRANPPTVAPPRLNPRLDVEGEDKEKLYENVSVVTA